MNAPTRKRVARWGGRLWFAAAGCALGMSALPVAAADAAATTRELTAVLRSESATLFDRVRACQQLAIIGTPEAVPALAALLTDAKLGHYAREALEAMASAEADTALRDALNRVQGEQLIGVVNSLGARQDRQAAPLLLQLAQDEKSPAANAALLALARIDASRMVDVRRDADGARRAAAAEAELIRAEDFVRVGKMEEAHAIYQTRFNDPDLPPQTKLSAARGAILTGWKDGAGQELIHALRSDDRAWRAVGLRAIRELPGEKVTPIVARLIDELGPVAQALILEALVDRGDEGVRELIERYTTAHDETVRLAAWRGLGRVGGASSVPLLLAGLNKGSTAENEAVRRSLAEIAVPGADETLLQALATSGAGTRVTLIGILGERGAEKATPAMLRLAGDADGATREAALRALALLAKPNDLPQLIRLSLAGVNDEARLLADRAILAAALKIPEPERRVEPVLAAFRAAKRPADQAALLRPLGAIVRATGGSEPAHAAVTGALRDSHTGVRAAAVKILADWPEATAVPALLTELEGNLPEELRAMALDGVVRLATAVAAGRDKTALDVTAVFTRANMAVRTDADRMKVVAGLGSVRRIESFNMLVPYLEVAAVRTEAALAIVQIAPALLGGADGPAVKRTLQRIAETEKDADVKAKAARLAKGGGAPNAAKKGKKKN